MARKMFLVVIMIAATCVSGLVFTGSSVVPSASAMTLGQRNREMMRRHNMRRRRRHMRRWHRRWERRHRRLRRGME